MISRCAHHDLSYDTDLHDGCPKCARDGMIVDLDWTMEPPVMIGDKIVGYYPDLEAQLSVRIVDDLCHDATFELVCVRLALWDAAGAITITSATKGDVARAVWMTAVEDLRHDSTLIDRVQSYLPAVWDDLSDLRTMAA